MVFGSITLHLHQIGSPPISGLPKTLNTFSVILTERHLLLRNAVWLHSAMDLLGNTRIISGEDIQWLSKGYFETWLDSKTPRTTSSYLCNRVFL